MSHTFLQLFPDLENDYIVFDEMPVNLHNLVPQKIWELKGKKSIIPSGTKG